MRCGTGGFACVILILGGAPRIMMARHGLQRQLLCPFITLIFLAANIAISSACS
jgi:hypothetical protein